MTKVTMTKGQLYDLAIGCAQAMALPGVKFAYAVVKTKGLIQTEVAALEAAKRPSPELITFDRERLELCKRHCSRDEHGNPVMTAENTFAEMGPLFQKELDELIEANKETIDQHEKQLEDFAALVAEDITLDIYKTKLEDVPDSIDGEILEKLMPMIEE